MRIDWSDLADEPDDAHMARRARPTPDDPDAAGRDQGNVGGSDSPPGSSPTRPDSALNIERAEAYRAAAYRQGAIDHGRARTEKPECETITPAMRRIEAEVLERHVVGLKNHSNERDRPTEAAELESFQCPDATTAAARVGSALGEHDIRVRERANDFPAVAQLASGDAYHGVAETTSVLVRNASGLRYPARETVADDVQTGPGGLPRDVSSIPRRREGRSSSSKLGKTPLGHEPFAHVGARCDRGLH